jgi:hypothetical protein
MERELTKTGNTWCKILKVEIANPIGWNNETHFLKSYITKEEFCNRAANSVVIPKPVKSRRDAAKYAKRKLS